MLSDIIIVPALFYAIYMVVRIMTDFLLKRKIIKSGHFGRADILSQGIITTSEAETMSETNKYPSLKWGLVAFMAGAGFVLIDLLSLNKFEKNNVVSMLSIGIELMFISAGFLLYFVIANYKSKAK